MKREFLKLAGLFFITFAVLTSCSKDEDKVNAPDTLVGTSWLWDMNKTTTVNGVEMRIAIELDFTSATAGQINILVGGKSNNTIVVSGFPAGEFAYTYSKPAVKIIVDGKMETGKIDGAKMTFDGAVFEKE